MKYKKQILILWASFFLLLNFNSIYANLWNFYKDSDFAWQWFNNDLRWLYSPTTNDGFWARSSHNMNGNFTNEIWVKGKNFYKWLQPDGAVMIWWYDINWDGKEDFLYWFDWKLYLYDLTSWTTLWETKPLNISKVVSIESMLWINQEKQIFITLSANPYIFWIINGKTWELLVSSGINRNDSNLYGITANQLPTVIYRPNWIIYVLYDRSWGWYSYGNKVYEENGIIKLKPLYHTVWVWFSSWGWWQTWGKSQIADINGKEYNALNMRNQYRLLDLSTANTGSKYTPSSLLSNYWNGTNYGGTASFSYDFNSDGNDEFIYYTSNANRGNNTFMPWMVVVWWTNWPNSVTNYFWLSTPWTIMDWVERWVRAVRVGKNYSDLSASHIFIKNWDNLWKWEAYKFSGSWSAWYLWDWAPLNNNFNLKLDYVYDGVNWEIAWIFNNGMYDLQVLSKNGKFYFYKYTGSGTFDTISPVSIDALYSSVACSQDKTKISSQKIPWYYCWVDTNWNGLKEFIIDKNWKYEFYEIDEIANNLTLKLIKTVNYNPLWENGTFLRKWFSFDSQNLWTVYYSWSLNTLNTYNTEILTSSGWIDTFWMKKTNITNIYVWWQTTNNIKIFKILNKNYVLVDSDLYDFSLVTPTNPPLLVKKWFWNCTILDVDPSLNDGNECLMWWKTYSIDATFWLNLKYNWAGAHVDWNWDGIRDTVLNERYWERLTRYRIYSWYDGSEIVPWVNSWSCWRDSWLYLWINWWNWKFTDFDGDGKIDILNPNQRCISNNIRSWNNLSSLGTSYQQYNNYLFDIDWDEKEEIIGNTVFANNTSSNLRATKINWNGTSTGMWNLPFSEIGRYEWWERELISINKDSTKVNIAFLGFNGRLISINPLDWKPYFDNYYYYNKWYSNMSWWILDQSIGAWSLYDDLWVPVNFADALVLDMNGDGKNEILAWSTDWFVYMIDPLTWNILKSYNIGASIMKILYWDVDNNGTLDIIVSTWDGYIYNLTNSNLPAPLWAKDWQNYWFDIETQTDYKKVFVNFAKVTKATGYFIQLYNKTEKSVVFDWINIWNTLKSCIASSDVVDTKCAISAGKTFSLNGKSIYEWRVQWYNNSVTSPTTFSNWFSVLKILINKKVISKENLGTEDFQDQITVPPNTLLTYKITVSNDSLNTIGWAGFMNYDMIPAQAVTNCTWITDCRTKNIILSDYMPSTFTYMPNSTIWIVKKINYDGSEQIVYGWSQVSDSYFKIQSGTKLTTSPWATLSWEFPNNISIPPWGFLELQFDAIARQ